MLEALNEGLYKGMKLIIMNGLGMLRSKGGAVTHVEEVLLIGYGLSPPLIARGEYLVMKRMLSTIVFVPSICSEISHANCDVNYFCV